MNNSSPSSSNARHPRLGGLASPAPLVARPALWSLVLRRAAPVWRRVQGLDVLVSVGGAR